MHFCWNIWTGFLWIVTLLTEGIWNIAYPKEEGETCIIACKCLFFSLQANMDGKPNVFEARDERPTIQEAYYSFLKNNISTKNKRQVLWKLLWKIKDRHLVYEFFDTSQGGYHPQMEPIVNTST